MMNLIVGGGGFLGKNLAELLLSKGQTVRIFERAGYDCSQFPLHRQIEWHYGDYSLERDILPALENIDAVYLFASTTTPRTSNDDYGHDIESNLLATVSFLDIASKRGVGKIIFPSSGGTVYGIPESSPISEQHANNPICSYGINKLSIEKYLALFQRQTGLQYIILRISNPYGRYQPANSGQGVITTFLDKALRDEEIEIWGDGSVIRDYIYIDDVTRALLCASKNNSEQRIFNIGSGTGYSLNQLLSHIEQLVGKKVRKRYLQGRLLDVPKNILDIGKAKLHLEWDPRYDLDQGLEATAKWLSSKVPN
ncbi:MAG: NAD-dependent epimerase/dehydratase family protein [Arenimonas sp.]